MMKSIAIVAESYTKGGVVTVLLNKVIFLLEFDFIGVNYYEVFEYSIYIIINY